MKLLASCAWPAFRTYVWMFAIAAGAWWLWPHSMAKRLDLDVGTTRDTFGILDRATGHLTEVTQMGEHLRDVDLPALNDARVVGTTGAAGLVWRDATQVAFAPMDHLADKRLYGKRVDKLCAQTATTHMNFGVAWRERDGAIWILRSSNYVSELAVPAFDLESDTAASAYCGITNADFNVALLYRRGNRLELMRCPERKRCGNPRKVELDGRDTILGFGCTWHFCMIAARDRRGVTTLHWLDDRANTVAKRTLEACKDGAVNVAGEGERFAIAYSNGPDPVVDFADAPGSLRRIYAGGDSNTTPALSWMGNALLIAAQRNGTLVWQSLIL
jgi:hypothetical protein